MPLISGRELRLRRERREAAADAQAQRVGMEKRAEKDRQEKRERKRWRWRMRRLAEGKQVGVSTVKASRGTSPKALSTELPAVDPSTSEQVVKPRRAATKKRRLPEDEDDLVFEKPAAKKLNVHRDPDAGESKLASAKKPLMGAAKKALTNKSMSSHNVLDRPLAASKNSKPSKALPKAACDGVSDGRVATGAPIDNKAASVVKTKGSGEIKAEQKPESVVNHGNTQKLHVDAGRLDGIAKASPGPETMTFPVDESADLSTSASSSQGGSQSTDSNVHSSGSTPQSSPVESRKRKAEEDQDAEVKTAKRQRVVVCPAPLKNGANACYVNAVLHTLSSIPEVIDELPAPASRLVDLLEVGQEDIDSAGKTRVGKQARRKLRAAVEALHQKELLSLSMCLSELLKEVEEGGDKEVNPEILLNMSGLLFQGFSGQPMDGEVQEDAGGYIQTVLEQLEKELPAAKLDGLFKVSLDTTMNCRNCKVAKTLSDADFSLSIPADKHYAGASAKLSELLQLALDDFSKFDDYRCPACEQKSGWEQPEASAAKVLSTAPTYLQVPISRQAYNPKKYSMEKVNTAIRLCTGLVDIGSCKYELIAAIQHKSTRANQGHYYVIRKIGEKWFDCDDTKYGNGVGQVSSTYVETDKRAACASFLLFKKIEA